MIGYRLKIALIAETYAAKHHYNWEGVILAGGRRRGLLSAGGVLRIGFGRVYEF